MKTTTYDLIPINSDLVRCVRLKHGRACANRLIKCFRDCVEKEKKDLKNEIKRKDRLVKRVNGVCVSDSCFNKICKKSVCFCNKCFSRRRGYDNKGYNKNYYLRNREKILKYNKEWYRNNREKAKGYFKKGYYSLSKIERSKRNKKYRKRGGL